MDLLNDEAAMAQQLEGVEKGAGDGFRWVGLLVDCGCCQLSRCLYR